MKDAVGLLEKKKHYVIWSGGCDSTAVLHEVAKQHSSEENHVVAISINHYLVGEKTGYEKKKREDIKEVFKERGLFIEHHEFEVQSSTNMDIGTTDGYNSASYQPYFWITQIMPFIEHDSYIHTGYIRGDDFWMNIDRIRTLVDACASAMARDVHFTTPLQYERKPDVLWYLIQEDLIQHTWHCEKPTEKGKCNNCVPCDTHNMALLEIGLRLDYKTIPYAIDKMDMEYFTQLVKDCDDRDGDRRVMKL